MKPSILFVLALLLSSPAFAQQDPDDPGIQDSVIVQTVTVNQAMRSVLVELYFVTDDPVMYLNIPLLWTSENDSIYPDQIYYQEIWGEDWGDTIMLEQHRINIFGFSGMNDTLNTHGTRQLLLSIQFQVASQTSQIISIDSTWDDRNGSLVFGLSDGVTEITPAFVPGGIIYSPQGSSDPLLKPNAFSILQNYPNPFNAQTTIEYTLSRASDVRLEIFDISGRKIAQIMDGYQVAGNNRVLFNASGLTSGIYFYNIRTNEACEYRKMIVVK